MEKDGKVFFQFSKYSLVGIIATILNISLMWLLIDILNFNTKISAAIILLGLFFLKFYIYLVIDLMHNRLDKFFYVNSISIFLNWLFMWIFVDFFGISAVISSSIIVISLFILRFIVFKIIKLIK